MKTVGDLLRGADPLRHEAVWSPQERLAIQQGVLAGCQVRPSKWRRPLIAAVASVGMMLIAGAAVAPRFFSSRLQAAIRFEVRLAEESPAPGLQAATLSQSSRTIYLHQEVVVTNEDIAEARVVPGDTPSSFGVDIMFSPRGAEKVSRATARHIGKPVAILLNGQIVAVPTLRSPISKAAAISGDVTRAEAERIAEGMIGR